MKILLPLLIAIVSVSEVSGQSDPEPADIKIAEEDLRRKGFVGVILGLSLPVGEFASTANDRVYSPNASPRAGNGLYLNLINFGYRFTGGFGITAKWYGGTHNLMVNNNIIGNYKPWSYGGVMAGPLIAIPLSKRVELDFRPMIGFNRTQLPVPKNADISISSKTGGAYSMGANLQFHLGQRIGMHFGLEYFHTKSEFTVSGDAFSQNISTINSTTGLFYRFN